MKKITTKRIGLDIDGVLADFYLGWHMLYPEIPSRPDQYNMDKKLWSRVNNMKEAGTLDDFYLNLQPLIKPEELEFDPHCYVTSRPVDSEITEKWLKKRGFPNKPVYTVPMGTSKVNVIKDAKIELFIDDFYKNFVDLTNNGILCYLFSAPWNLMHDVGDMRIY